MDWAAQWIRFGWGAGAPLLRRRFSVGRPVRRAVLKATALGVCEPRLNGKKVGDVELLPGWTDYRKRVYFHAFDVTSRIRQGENMLGAMLAPGWFAGFCGPFGDRGYYGHDAWFSCLLEMEFEDGTVETLCSDASWQGRHGPVESADLLMGESYDARKEVPGWDRPESGDEGWLAVVAISSEERLPETVGPHPGVPVKAVAELPAQRAAVPKPGVQVFDLGQNMVGVVRLKMRVPAGTRLVLRHGEMLGADGTVYTENLRSAQATDRYVAKGGGEEVWQPRFTFHGFRYVQVEGLPPASCHAPLDTVTGVVWMSAVDETASFECSNEKVNRLFSNIQWSFRGNYIEIPTDCPQRDERLGWTGDAQVFVRSASYLADIRPFFRKWLVDLNDAQRPDGGYPDVAPWLGRLGHAAAAWSDAGIICPYVLWRAYGDPGLVRPWWAGMKRFMALICTDDNRHNGPAAVSFGDWLHFNSDTPVRLIGLAYRAYDAQLMAEMAAALGETADQAHFAAEAQKSRRLFRDAFFGADGLPVETQTACALAVAMDLLDGSDLDLAKEALVRCVGKHGGYLTTGFVGTGYLCPALTRAGRGDLAVQLLLNEGHPSWLYEVDNGATTIWERWNSWTKEGGFGDVGMNSFNHYAFGAVCEWMFESLAGIRPGAPGFASLVVEPCLTNRLDYVKASYESVQGRIAVEWRRAGEGYDLDLETPVPAEVRLPGGSESVGKGRHRFRIPRTARAARPAVAKELA